jgi:hypothetical protein
MAQLARTILLAALFIALPSQLVVLVEDPGSFPYIAAARRQSVVVRRAMRYHGTGRAFSDGLIWYFHDRDGKLCRLFTRNCRRSISG